MKLFSFEDETTQDVETLDPVSSAKSAVNEIIIEAEQNYPDEELNAVNNAIEAGNDLEEVEEFVRKQEQKGGMDEDTAEAVRLAVEAIAHRVGYNPKRIYQLYATESFATSSSRKVNTQLAMEGIKEFLAELWEKVKKFVMTLWEKIKEFWKKHFTNVKHYIKKLETLNEEVKKSNFANEGANVKTPDTLVHAFRTNTSDLNVNIVKEYITKVSDFTLHIRNNMDIAMKKVLDNIYDDIVNETRKYRFDFKQVMRGNIDIRESMIHVIVTSIQLAIGTTKYNGYRTVLIDDVVGGRELVIDTNSSGQPVIILEKTNKPNKNTNMIIPSKNDLINLNKEVIEMLNDYIYIKENIDKVEKINEEFNNKLNKYYKKYFQETGYIKDKVDEFVIKSSVNFYTRLFSTINAFFGKTVGIIKIMVVDTTKAHIQYVESCLKQSQQPAN
jgi:hypothetical protein